MNEDQLHVARKYQSEIGEKWGYVNTEFVQGFIEDLSWIEDESIDIVISNCVMNLVPEKEKLYQEIWRVLKTG